MLFLTEFADVCSFVDDTKFFACDSDFKRLKEFLQHDKKVAIEWFENNCIKLNENNCYLLAAGHKYETLWASI